MLPPILERCRKLGYKIFDNDFEYDLNIIGERRTLEPNTFDDILHVLYKLDGLWQHEQFKCTTDPGTYHLLNPSRTAGTAILAPGQYRNSHELGYHRGKYKALVQRRPVKVFRDNNKNEIAEVMVDSNQVGIYGINIHKAGKNLQFVNKWSAGCTVIAKEIRYNRFIELCEMQIKTNNFTTFSYTLLG